MNKELGYLWRLCDLGGCVILHSATLKLCLETYFSMTAKETIFSYNADIPVAHVKLLVYYASICICFNVELFLNINSGFS